MRDSLVRQARGSWQRGCLVACAAALLAPLGLHAQTSELRVEARDSPLRCIGPAESDLPAVVYPALALERQRDAVVRVRLSFSDAQSAPSVEVFYNSAESAFAEAVRARVLAYRLPCLKATDGPVVATQEFQFLPGDGRKVIWGPARRSLDKERMMAACLSGVESRQPSYPASAVAAGQQGVVVVRMKFASPDEPPRVEVITDSGSRPLGRAVRDFVERYRLPCLPNQGPPLEFSQAFQFKIDGEPEYALKDASLRQFLGSIDRLEQHRVRFNFNTMACPFDIKLRLYQPHMKNQIGEVGASDPNRADFVEWLENVALKLPSDALKQVLGATMNIAVPCGVLDLL